MRRQRKPLYRELNIPSTLHFFFHGVVHATVWDSLKAWIYSQYLLRFYSQLGRGQEVVTHLDVSNQFFLSLCYPALLVFTDVAKRMLRLDTRLA